MRYLILVVPCLALSLLTQGSFAGATTLQQAMSLAATSHPQVQMAKSDLDIASGNAADLGQYAYNPELTLAPQRRRLPGGTGANDYYITLSQSIEMGGKHSYRQAAAKSELQLAQAAMSSIVQQLQLEAASAYIDLYYIRQVFVLNEQVSQVYAQVLKSVKRLQYSGDISKMDLNLVQSAYMTSINASLAARQDLLAKELAYFRAIGQDDTDTLLLPHLPKAWQAPENVLALALASRPDLKAVEEKLRQAKAFADLADAGSIPDWTVSAMVGRETNDRLVSLGLTIPLPVFYTNEGRYKAALATEERHRSEINWAKRNLHVAIDIALRNHQTSTAAALTIESSSMMQDSDETILLAQQSYQAGEMEAEEMVVRIKQAVDAKISAISTLNMAWLARLQLAGVLGQPNIIFGDN